MRRFGIDRSRCWGDELTILPRTLPLAACALLVAAAGLLAPTVARADTASITVVDPSGNPEPGQDLANTFTVAGTATAPRFVFVLFRPAGGAPCAPTAATDTGQQATNLVPYSTAVDGAFSIQRAGVWTQPAGTYTFCMWISSTSFGGTIGTVFSQNITFRQPRGSVALRVSSPHPYPGQTITLSFVGSSEAQREVFAAYRPAGGAPCSPTYASDSGTGLIGGNLVNGSFTVLGSPMTFKRGRYQVCMWLAGSSGDQSPIGGQQTAVFDVRSLATALAAKLTSRRGQRIRVSGKVTSPFGLPAGTCLLQRAAGSSWKTVGSAPAHADGSCAFTRRVAVTGRFNFRVVFRPGSEQWGPSRTAPKALRVRK